MKPTTMSMNVYLKIFLIHLLIIYSGNENKVKMAKQKKVDFDKLKKSVFNFFKFNNEWKTIYEECLRNYYNEIKYSEILIKKYMLYGFGKEIEKIELNTNLYF